MNQKYIRKQNSSAWFCDIHIPKYTVGDDQKTGMSPTPSSLIHKLFNDLQIFLMFAYGQARSERNV